MTRRRPFDSPAERDTPNATRKEYPVVSQHRPAGAAEVDDAVQVPHSAVELNPASVLAIVTI
ncbi:MAG: hypothetical protein AB7P34_23175, partial [Vicinamibacterales bacterium]